MHYDATSELVAMVKKDPVLACIRLLLYLFYLRNVRVMVKPGHLSVQVAETS